MLRSLKHLQQYAVTASDGEIGSVVNFLLDDERWAVRYLVVEGGGVSGRRVLISPIAFAKTDWSTRRFHLALTNHRVQRSPAIDTDKPVSRQHEREYHRYYGYPYYWGHNGVWGTGHCPGSLAVEGWDEAAAARPEAGDVHLRSVDEVRGYHVQATDGASGHVEDFIVDDETWEVRYLVVDTSNWWFGKGKKVLVAPKWASNVSWYERKIYVDATRQAIKESPKWNATVPIDRGYETRLYDYYGCPVYWYNSNRPGIVPQRRPVSVEADSRV
jgi:sporulation protein YlmC with PRC-barrel domain